MQDLLQWLATHPTRQEAAFREPEQKSSKTISMMWNCVTIQQMMRAAAINTEGETVKYSAKVVESIMEVSQSKWEEERKQQVVIESRPEQEGEGPGEW